MLKMSNAKAKVNLSFFQLETNYVGGWKKTFRGLSFQLV